MAGCSSVLWCAKCGTRQIVVGTVQPCESCGGVKFKRLASLVNRPICETDEDRDFLKVNKIKADG